ncbi:MAG TPA: ABC transporter ATP-binding protein [Bacteroidia bacterium]|nr:ABC transporter ATP-binding protein [Bacteroidia bacterium]HNT80921.1 ABC transporter ATP-binding protein [Bacteroidia bacterium]
MDILIAENITKYFYDPVKFKVLDDISFKVKQGEFMALVGKSGCGKSTLLYVLSTLDTDYSGNLKIANNDLYQWTQSELSAFRNQNIGFVFQFHYLLPEFSCLENVMIPALKLARKSKNEIEHDAMNKLKILGIDDQALKPAHKLSGGQQQRVAIARALINEPSIIMCDEPTGNLDTYNTDLVFDIFKMLTHELKQSIIAVTHDNDFSARCDRIVEMADGKIIS